MKYEDIKISLKRPEHAGDPGLQMRGVIHLTVELNINDYYENDPAAMEEFEKMVRRRLVEMLFGDLRAFARSEREGLFKKACDNRNLTFDSIQLNTQLLSQVESFGNHLIKKPKTENAVK